MNETGWVVIVKDTASGQDTLYGPFRNRQQAMTYQQSVPDFLPSVAVPITPPEAGPGVIRRRP